MKTSFPHYKRPIWIAGSTMLVCGYTKYPLRNKTKKKYTFACFVLFVSFVHLTSGRNNSNNNNNRDTVFHQTTDEYVSF